MLITTGVESVNNSVRRKGRTAHCLPDFFQRRYFSTTHGASRIELAVALVVLPETLLLLGRQRLESLVAAVHEPLAVLGQRCSARSSHAPDVARLVLICSHPDRTARS